MRTLLVCLSLMSGLAQARGLSSTDICAVRPDLCDQPARTTARRPAAAAPFARIQKRVANTRPSARVSTCRPASVQLNSANQSLPTCGSAITSSNRAPASATVAVQSVSFASYMNANAANPALSRKVANYQSAFKSTAKAATFVAPDIEGSGTREGAAPTVAPAEAPRNNQ